MQNTDDKTILLLDDIIYHDVEPGILNSALIEDCYFEHAHRGEERRLHQLEPIVWERIKSIRIEFKNILRIDYLWILPNLTKLCLNFNKIEVIEHLETLTELKELNLSFNLIEKIENLDTLIHLESLSMYNNKIKKIENMESLENLVILSIGNNRITSVEGIDRFRFLKSLKVLNLEGNPIAQNVSFPLYIITLLPNLNYYHYTLLKNEVRDKAHTRFCRELQEIEYLQEKELQARQAQELELLKVKRLAFSFVDHLDGNQMFDAFWREDVDGRILMMVGQQAQELAEEYEKDVFELTQEIYKLGLKRFVERDEEITDFMDNLLNGQKELQILGQKEIQDFLKYKDKIFEEARVTLRLLEENVLHGEDEDSLENLKLSDVMDKLNVHFEDALNDMWLVLMSQELHLNETIEESTTNFYRKISDMMSKFLEQSQAFFVQLREMSVHFSENMTEIITRYISTKLAMQDFEGVPSELRDYMDDREAILNLIAGMKDTHTLRIDEREDRMATRSKEFIDNMVQTLNNKEVQRHRSKLLEINCFIEMMTDGIGSLPHEIREELVAEEYGV